MQSITKRIVTQMYLYMIDIINFNNPYFIHNYVSYDYQLSIDDMDFYIQLLKIKVYTV